MSRRRLCVVTGSRAEYGLLYWVLHDLRAAPDVELQLVVTGMHLAPEFGLTVREIERDGFTISRRVDMLLSGDTPAATAKSIGLGVIGLSDALEVLAPELVVVLGDRFEILAAVQACLVHNIPIAHIAGGDTTEGAFDEAIRHSITKMSHLHFVAAEDYRKRVIQLGEHPKRVFLVGGLGIDNIKRQRLLSRRKLEEALSFKLGTRNLLITFHPVTLERATSSGQMGELLAALELLEDTHLIFTMPNADTGSRVLFEMIRQFAANRTNARVFTSLGQLLYLSCIMHMDGVLGNSSSGLTEVPSFRKGTVNIGDRQRGRLKADSVIDCDPNRRSILTAIQRLYSPEFQRIVKKTRNPYGERGASEGIVHVLKTASLNELIKKPFHDLLS